VEAARRTLGEPLHRAGFDAVRGNLAGLERCVDAGLTEESIEPMRRAFLAARPEAEARARTLFTQGHALEVQRALRGALVRYSEALALDPLNMSWLRHYQELRRKAHAVASVNRSSPPRPLSERVTSRAGQSISLCVPPPFAFAGNPRARHPGVSFAVGPGQYETICPACWLDVAAGRVWWRVLESSPSRPFAGRRRFGCPAHAGRGHPGLRHARRRGHPGLRNADSGTPDGGPIKPPPDWPALQTSIPVYRLTVSAEHLKALNDNIDDRDYQVPASFTADGRSYSVEVRYRGRSTRYEVKKPWQVRFNKEDRFNGVKRIELLASYKDGGYLTEKLWYDTAASLGLHVPRTRYVNLYVNGQYEGVYVELESVTKDFLASRELDDDGDIYRCGMHDCELRPAAEAAVHGGLGEADEREGALGPAVDLPGRAQPHAAGPLRGLPEEQRRAGRVPHVDGAGLLHRQSHPSGRPQLPHLQPRDGPVDVRPLGLEQRAQPLQPQDAAHPAGREE
jgi:hypothetical protein